MYTIQDFLLVSTEADDLLFFNRDFQEAVNRAINRALEDCDTLGRNLKLIVHRSIVEIKDDNDPDFDRYEILEDYPAAGETPAPFQTMILAGENEGGLHYGK